MCFEKQWLRCNQEAKASHLKQMKLFNAIATAAVVAASLVATPMPVAAQHYGNYGNRNNPYDRHRRSYDVKPYNKNSNDLDLNPRRNPSTPTQNTNSYTRKNNTRSSYIK